MLRLIAGAALICAISSISSWSEANCAKDLGRLISGAKWPAKPSDSDFHAALSSVRLRAHLILREALDNSADQTWFQPKARYFIGTYKAKSSPSSHKSVIALFDREDGLWAYQVKPNIAGSESVCLNPRRVASALSDLVGKNK